MYPPKVSKRASVAEAQLASGLSTLQYKSFSAITHEAAKNLLSKDTEWTRWTRVPSAVKLETQQWVNAELEKLKIADIREDVFEWRMSRALPDAARAESNRMLAEPIEGIEAE